MGAAAASVQHQGWQTAAQQQFAEWAADTGGSLQGAGQQQGASSCLSSSVVAPPSAVLFQDGTLPVAAAFSFAAANSGEGVEAQGTAYIRRGPGGICAFEAPGMSLGASPDAAVACRRLLAARLVLSAVAAAPVALQVLAALVELPRLLALRMGLKGGHRLVHTCHMFACNGCHTISSTCHKQRCPACRQP